MDIFLGLLIPSKVFAGSTCDATQDILCDPTVQRLVTEVIRPLIVLVFSLALIYFLFGMIRYIAGLAKGDKTKVDSGRKHMIWGIVGLAIMLSAYAIVSLINYTVTGDNQAQGIGGTPVTKPSVIDKGL